MSCTYHIVKCILNLLIDSWWLKKLKHVAYVILLCMLCTTVSSTNYCTRSPYVHIFPDVLSMVGDTSWGIRVGFIKTDKFVTIFLFICIWGVKSVVQLIKYKFIFEQKEKINHHLTPELVTCCFRWPRYAPPRSHRLLPDCQRESENSYS